MNDDIDPVPVIFELLKYRFNLLIAGDVARYHDFGSETLGKRTDSPFKRIPNECKCQIDSLSMKRLRDAPRNTSLVRDTKYDSLFAS